MTACLMIYITLKRIIYSGVCFLYRPLPGKFPSYFRTLSKAFFLEPVSIEVGISGLQPFIIKEKEEAMQRVLFKHLFLSDFFVLFLKKKAPLRIFPYVFETFVAAISKHSHEKSYGGVW